MRATRFVAPLMALLFACEQQFRGVVAIKEIQSNVEALTSDVPVPPESVPDVPVENNNAVKDIPLSGGAAAAVPTSQDSPAEESSIVRCTELLQDHREIRQGTPTKWLETFDRLLSALNEQVQQPDKVARAALHSLSTVAGRSIDLDFATQLGHCAVDDDQNPVLFLVVKRGFIGALDSLTLWNMFLPAEDLGGLCHVLNKNGDNLIHMAVRSTSKDVLSIVLSHLTKAVAVDAIKPMLEHRNVQGQRPLDLAHDSACPADVIEALKAEYGAHYVDIGPQAADDDSQDDLI